MIAYGFWDGAAVTKPAHIAGYGAVLFDEYGNLLKEIYKAIGNKTSNEAEYRGCLRLVQTAIEIGVTELHITGDSQLVVNQVLGKFTVFRPELKQLHHDIVTTLKQIPVWTISWVPREENTYADALSKIGLAIAKKEYEVKPWK